MTTAYRDQFAALPAEGPAWLGTLRRSAIDRFDAYGFPTTKNEDWHFTSPAPVVERVFGTMPPGATTTGSVAGLPMGGMAWPTLVFVNGRYAPHLSRVEVLPAGVRVLTLAAALHEEPSLVEQHMGKLARFEDQAFAFTALNTALQRDGAVVHVARDAQVETPIHLVFIAGADAEGGAAYPRNLLVLEPGAQLTVLEQYTGAPGTRYLTNAVTEAAIGDGATLRHYRLQCEGNAAGHVGHVEASVGRDAHLVSFSFATGAEFSRINIYARLAGAGCGATLNGLYMLDGRQHCDHQTSIEHIEPNCYSREMYKGILDGESHGVFNGKVYVHPEAQKTDGKQTNNTLLLSERARIDTKPQLEIFADDVKCTHGATVGRLDALAAFYMKSRGIPAAVTRRLLTYAFAAEVLETMELEPLKDELERMTMARYAG